MPQAIETAAAVDILVPAAEDVCASSVAKALRLLSQLAIAQEATIATLTARIVALESKP